MLSNRCFPIDYCAPRKAKEGIAKNSGKVFIYTRRTGEEKEREKRRRKRKNVGNGARVHESEKSRTLRQKPKEREEDRKGSLPEESLSILFADIVR